VKTEKSLITRALEYLARREHTRAELSRKLAPHAQDPQEIEPVLDTLERGGWLSEARFTEQLTASRRGRFGAARITRELLERGVSEEIVEAALPALKQSDLESARAVWSRKFGRPPADAKERAHQSRFLKGRGFSTEVIRKVLRMEDD
jgi:regulatory protein